MINGLKNNWKLNESNLGKSISVIGRVWHKEVSDNQILLYLFDKTTIYTCQFKKELQTAKQVTNETFIKVNGVISKA